MTVLSVLATPATSLDSVNGGQGHGRRRKLGYGEGHGADELAGIPRRCGHALLVGTDKLGGIDEILCRADQTNEREKTDGNNQRAVIVVTAVFCVAERSGQASANGCGDVACTAATTAGNLTGRLQNTNTQSDRLYDLDHRRRYSALLVARLRLGAESGTVATAAEDGDVALTAPKHDLLFNDSNSVKFLASPGTDTTLKDQPDVVTNRDGVKAAVELNGVNADIGPGDASILHTHLGGVVNDLLTEIGQKNLDVFIAIPVAAGIQNAVGLDAKRITGAVFSATVRKKGRTAGEFVFTHINKPPYRIGRKPCSLA